MSQIDFKHFTSAFDDLFARVVRIYDEEEEFLCFYRCLHQNKSTLKYFDHVLKSAEGHSACALDRCTKSVI